MAKRWIRKEIWYDAMNRAATTSHAAADAKANLDRAKRDAKAAKDALNCAQGKAGNAGSKQLDEANKKLEAQLEELELQLRLELGTLQNWMREQLDAMGDDMQALEQRTAQVERNVADLKEKMEEAIRNMAQEKEAKRQRALLYSAQLSHWISNISALHADKLTPLEAEELIQTAELITADLSCGDYEAAIGVAQTKIPVAATLYLRLQELNAQYNEMLEAVFYAEALLDDLTGRLSDAEQNRTVLEATQLEYDGEIDFWSEGTFSELTEHINSCKEAERQAEERMDMEAMEAHLDSLPGLIQDVAECHNRAIRECTLSQYCELQSYDIYEQLTKDSAWECEEYGFEDDDKRRSLVAVYSDGGNLTATVAVLPQREIPAKDAPQQNLYLVHLCDGDTVQNAVYCDIARNAVYARLAEIPLYPGSGKQQRAATSSPSARMFQRHTQQQTEDLKRERLTPLVRTAEQT